MWSTIRICVPLSKFGAVKLFSFLIIRVLCICPLVYFEFNIALEFTIIPNFRPCIPRLSLVTGLYHCYFCTCRVIWSVLIYILSRYVDYFVSYSYFGVCRVLLLY